MRCGALNPWFPGANERCENNPRKLKSKKFREYSNETCRNFQLKNLMMSLCMFERVILNAACGVWVDSGRRGAAGAVQFSSATPAVPEPLLLPWLPESPTDCHDAPFPGATDLGRSMDAP